ncbi:MAG: T9SS type A sorting domain-containing protein, partial [Chitinophagaceae bacterium]
PALTPSEALQPTAFAGALFGFSVSKAGDINNDGFDDVVIGAPGDHVDLTIGIGTVSSTVGRVYIYYGNTFDGNVNTEPVVSLSVNLNQADFGILASAPANPLYGFSVSDAGDVNNDGFADIVVGSPAYLNLIPVNLGGRADVYLGSGTGLGTTPHKIVGGLIGGLFGYSVSTAGKVNNDAFDDIIVGAPASIGIVAIGAAYVFHGSGTGITANNVAGANTTLQAPGLLAQTLFGYSVSNAGDVNNDGRADVIIGEPLSLEQTLSLQLVAVGKAHIFYGSTTGVVTTGSTQLTSPRRPNLLGLVQGNLLFGFSVSTAGDVNCDGITDVIVGEPGGTAISLGTGVLGLVSANAASGKAYVYYGRTTTGPINSPSFLVQETGALAVANLLGASVSDAGDVNKNGSGDILIGAPNGTMNFNSSLTGIVGSAIGIITQNSVGSAYSYFNCLASIDLDFDNDGIPDAVDLDDDNDGVPDIAEYPGLGLTEDPAGDADGDGIPNYMDSDFTGCGGLNGAGVCTAFDKDGDGIPNSFDLDSDNDGIPDVIEAGGVDTNGDGILDNVTDTDNDGLAQSVDANNTGAAGSGTGLGSPDFDGDGIPNSLDIDSDGDGITDLREAGLPDANNDGRIDGFVDADGDGFADSVDPKTGHSGASDPAGTGTPAVITPTDSNNDGRYDGNPTVANKDNDARFNFLDLDADNDGITDNVEGQPTIGYVLPAAGDADGDGLADTYDTQGGVFTAGGLVPFNYDGTDEPDYLDTDTDNDGEMDIQEGHDINTNGVPDDIVTLTGTDTDGDGIDDRFDLVNGPNPTTGGIGNPPIPGAQGPLQATGGNADRDWRNALLILPLKLSSFTAKQNGSIIVVEWTTENEENVSHFELERRGDGKNFSTLGNVAATGTNNGPAHYSYVDQQPLPDRNYYRLKMVDNDGRVSYSNVLLLSTNSNVKGINIYPNPVSSQFQLVFQQMPKADYRMELLNTTGQVIKMYSVKVSSANQAMLITRESLWKPGVYLLRITNVTDKSVVAKHLILQ